MLVWVSENHLSSEAATTMMFPIFVRVKLFRSLGFIVWIFLAFSSVLGFAEGVDRPREVLDGEWFFTKNSADTPEELARRNTQLGWISMRVPHTFNANDADDGGGYYRGAGWYRTTFKMADDIISSRRFMEFGGAALRTEVWINGQFVGKHDGGYTKFRFDVSAFLRRGKNQLYVRVDNTRSPSIAPLNGDFSVFGGLYKPVSIFSTAHVHLDVLDYSGPGVYATITNVSAKSVDLELHTRIKNESAQAINARLRHNLRGGRGELVNVMEVAMQLPANKVTENTLRQQVIEPHLWQGIQDPYLYSLETQLILVDELEEKVLDGVQQNIGFRHITVDPEKGLFLNGKPYAVYGVNIHLSQRPHKGTAVSEKEVAEDFLLLDELGVTGLRLAHYPHPPAVYEHADKKGYLLWTEVPLVSEVNDTPEFIVNLKQQFLELIHQNYNHPSVFIWGIGNEVYKQDETSNRILAELHALAKSEDSTRFTSYANCCSSANSGHAQKAELNASNVYAGWYAGQDGVIGDWVARTHKDLPAKALSISEFGAGGSVLHQEQNPERPDTAGKWHPEQYQAQVHEDAWLSLKDKAYLWANFLWLGFDFASDGRAEGDRDGINDKGLVSYDRKVRKDAYFWYQANWSTEPMVYITSRRDTLRVDDITDVKVYSNQQKIALKVNGEALQDKNVVDNIAVWKSVQLRPGKNRIEVSAQANDGNILRDKVLWVLVKD